MKKSLIAMAVLAASGAAMAQSSVTLYGIVDSYVGSVKTGVGAARVSQTVVNNGGIQGSRFGFKGSEDLGGGLKAIFQLEDRFSVDTGSIGTNALFHGRSAVGLSGGFGEVKLGREYTIYDDIRGGFAGGVVFDASAFSPVGDVFGLGSDDYAGRANNQIRYVTPNFSGFTAGVSYGLGEDKAVGVKASHIAAVNVAYANGPLSVGYAYQEEKPVSTSTAGTDKYNFLGASYNFGVVKLTGMYQNRKLLAVKDNDFAFGVEVPLGAFTVNAGFASAKEKDGSGTLFKSSGFGVAGSYALSKRTDVYAGLKTTQVKDGAGTKIRDNDTLGLGIRHKF